MDISLPYLNPVLSARKSSACLESWSSDGRDDNAGGMTLVSADWDCSLPDLIPVLSARESSACLESWSSDGRDDNAGGRTLSDAVLSVVVRGSTTLVDSASVSSRRSGELLSMMSSASPLAADSSNCSLPHKTVRRQLSASVFVSCGSNSGTQLLAAFDELQLRMPYDARFASDTPLASSSTETSYDSG